MPNNRSNHRDIETGDDHNTMDGSSHKVRKSLKKQFMKKMFHHKKNKNGELAPLTDPQQQHEVKTAGTFEASVSTLGETHYYEHPRSQARMVNKWGQLKDIMSATNTWTDKVFRSFQQQDEDGYDDVLDPRERAARIKKAQNEIRHEFEFTLAHCLVAILLYIAATVYCFSFWLEPDWTVVDSIYFSVVTFTTIGYGDVTPDTRSARIFTCVWALSGVACLGIFLGVLGSELVQVAEKEQKQENSLRQSEVFQMFSIDHVPRQIRSGDESTTASNWSDIESIHFQDDDIEEDQSSCVPSCLCSPKTQRFFWLTLFMALLLFFMAQTEDWTMWTTIYYGLITACTVGYGDFSPISQTGRILAVLYIPVAVTVIGSLLDVVANAIIDIRKQRGERKLRDKELTLEDLRVMDGDGDGTVTKAEFLEFMLVAMNQVDQDLLDNLKSHFERLDKDKSGTLDKNDLINVARYNLQKEKSSKRFRSEHF